MLWQRNIARLIRVLGEIVGYLSRSIVAAQYPNCSTVPYLLNTILPLMAPAPLAASMYPILGHIIHETGGERLALVRASWRTKILLLGDILSGATQAIGMDARRLAYIQLTCDRYRRCHDLKSQRLKSCYGTRRTNHSHRPDDSAWLLLFISCPCYPLPLSDQEQSYRRLVSRFDA